MDLLARVLGGEAAAVAALEAGDETTWTVLVEHLFEKSPPAAPAALVEAMLAIDAEPPAWSERAKRGIAQARSAWFTTITSAMKRVRPWLSAGVRAVRPPGDPAVLWIRLEEVRATLDEDALQLARALVADAERAGAPAALRAQALLLLARRAHEEREIEEGIAASRRASSIDPEIAPLAARREGALLLAARRVDEALAALAAVMETRGPLFGGGGSFRMGGGDADPLDDALDEAATIAGWASRTTPEWVRALGGIAERSGLAWERFEEALEAMVAASQNPISDLEVVARQARQRGMQRTALAAADVLAARFPESLDAASIAGPHLAAAGQHERASRLYEHAGDAAQGSDPDKGRALLRATELARASGDLDRAQALLERARPWLGEQDAMRVRVLEIELAIAREREGAIERGLALLAELDPHVLAETPIGFALVDVLVRALIARRDRRALEVQQRLVDAKRELWGQSPALALEQHNLATIHAELGDRAVAREGLEAALSYLRRALGDGHPHVELAKRSLARLDAS